MHLELSLLKCHVPFLQEFSLWYLLRQKVKSHQRRKQEKRRKSHKAVKIKENAGCQMQSCRFTVQIYAQCIRAGTALCVQQATEQIPKSLFSFSQSKRKVTELNSAWRWHRCIWKLGRGLSLFTPLWSLCSSAHVTGSGYKLNMSLKSDAFGSGSIITRHRAMLTGTKWALRKQSKCCALTVLLSSEHQIPNAPFNPALFMRSELLKPTAPFEMNLTFYLHLHMQLILLGSQ